MPFNKLGGRIKDAFYKSITPPLPRRVKRLIIVSSIVGVVKGANVPDEMLISKLNKALHLDYKSAWLFPMKVHNLIWNFKEGDVIQVTEQSSLKVCELGHCNLSTLEIDKVVDRFFKIIPNWLRYGSEELIRHDIRNVIVSVQQVC